jgi:hypothetical protein
MIESIQQFPNLRDKSIFLGVVMSKRMNPINSNTH